MTADRWATFDCYGTLVDWMTGIGVQLSSLWPDQDRKELLDRYHALEPAIQAGRGIPYRQVMRETLLGLAEAEGLDVPGGEADSMAESLARWPVFGEAPAALQALRDRDWRLAILSNTDTDLLATSIEAIGVRFDHLVVASRIGSYKPAFGHWETFFREIRADRARHVHVAASLFHDIEPAAKLGLPAVWINRLDQASPVPRSAEMQDLAGLDETLERLVPA